jgi:hypothetical protein
MAMDTKTKQATYLRMLAGALDAGELSLQQFPAEATYVPDSEKPDEIVIPQGSNTITIEYTMV